MTTLRRVAATAIALAVLTLAGCSTTAKPDAAACKQAMREQYQTALKNPSGPAASRPAACNGVDDSTLERLAGEVLAE
jgi:outer membrane murein-binding lipoprotein Lpp